MKTGPKIITMDIETLPITAYAWHLFDEPRALDRLVKDWAIYQGAFKRLGDKRVEIMDTEVAGDPYDDKHVVEWLCDALDECDIVVGQNVRKFDLRKIRARAILHGLKPFREPEVVDTLLLSREVAQFTSHKLEYMSAQAALSTIQKSKHTKFPGFEMWLAIMQGNPAAYKESRDYNVDDVRSTEEVYLNLRPWAIKHPNVAAYYDDERRRCRICGSPNVHGRGDTVKRGVSEYHAFKCNDCGAHQRDRFTVNTKEKRRVLTTYAV